MSNYNNGSNAVESRLNLTESRVEDVREDLRDLNHAVVELSKEVGRYSERLDHVGSQVDDLHKHLLGESTKQSEWQRKAIWGVLFALLSIISAMVGVKVITLDDPPAIEKSAGP